MSEVEIKELQKKLREKSAQHKAIVDGFPGIMGFFDTDLHLIWLNKAGSVQLPKGEGKHCREFFCEKEATCDKCAVARSLVSGKIESSLQRIGDGKSEGDENVYDISASPVIDDNAEIQGTIVIAQNVSERYSLERQLRHTQKMEAIGTLAGGVAHDFNNVLTPIMGYSEIIKLKMKQEGLVSEGIDSYLSEILKAAKRAKSLVEQVLTFSRSTEKRATLQYLHPIVKEVMKLMKVTLPSTITIREEIDEKCGRVMVDPVQIHQVLINLCTNASHAMTDTHGELVVRLARSEDQSDGKQWVELVVSDNGRGIPEPHLERIFEPYFTTKEKTRGTGMGLAMVHGIIKRQGGKISVDSTVGKGTTFKMSFPVADKITPVERIVSSKEITGGTGSILLVDDEEQVVKVTGEILQSLGYSVTTCVEPIRAVEIFSRNPDAFDLVITDLTMPGLTGLELSKKIKDMRSDVSIILSTGYSDQISKANTKEAGIDAYFMKPVSMRELSSLVASMLS